ncbi:MAG: TonB C-terminal domain-containing protein [Desulfobacteraceae bacterium]|jgi:colicin import membrane protein
MPALPKAFVLNGNQQPYKWPFAVSLGAHAILLALFIWSPQWRSEPSYIPSIIDVQMVDLQDMGTAPKSKEVEAMEKAPVRPEPKKTEPAEVSVAEPSQAKPEVSVAPKRKKTKKALKYKTFKSEEVKQKALERIKRQVESATPKPLQDKFKELREKVAKEGKPGPQGKTADAGTKPGKAGIFTQGSRKEMEAIDLYRMEVAYAVNKNWAFADQLSGGKKQVVSLVFKVLPDGSIEDIFFTDRSGNSYLDDSAYKAIVKSSPVKAFPPGLGRKFIEVGLRFGPEGVR